MRVCLPGFGVLTTIKMITPYNDKNPYNNVSESFLENFTYHYDNITSSISDPSWLMTLVDRSQQVMTIVGVIANVGTSVTLIKNGQVSVSLATIKNNNSSGYKSKTHGKYRCNNQ